MHRSDGLRQDDHERVLELPLHVVGKTREARDVHETVEVLPGGCELRGGKREPPARDAGLREGQECMGMVETRVLGATKDFGPLELALRLLHPTKLQQGLAERVMCDTG